MPRRERSKFFVWAARVKDKTRQRYRKAVNDFITWCDENNIEAERTRDLDWALFLFRFFVANFGCPPRR
jgi:hypothetical protein